MCVDISRLVSVGFALEDCLAPCDGCAQAQEYGVGEDMLLMPPAGNPTDLFARIGTASAGTVARATDARPPAMARAARVA